jgi:hypothetical protein
MVLRLNTHVKVKVHHEGDIRFKDGKYDYYHQWFYYVWGVIWIIDKNDPIHSWRVWQMLCLR